MKALRGFLRRSGGDEILFVLVAAAFALGWVVGWDSTTWGNAIFFLAALAAVFSVRSARKTARQRATLDFLRAYNESPAATAGAAILNDWKSGDRVMDLDKGKALMVLEFLNLLEFLAIGLRNGIYDEQMVCDAMQTAIVRYYKKAKPFIDHARDRKEDVWNVAFEHFEGLAERIQQRMKKP